MAAIASKLPYAKADPSSPAESSEPVIVACRFGSGHASTDCGDLFLPTYTNDGVGYTFNAVGFWETYSRTEWAEKFFSQYGEVEMDEDHGGEYPRHVENNGPAFALEVLVSTRASGIEGGGHQMRDRRVDFAIHSPNELPDVVSRSVRLKTGTTVDAFVSASQVVTMPQVLRSVSPEKRDCLSEEEGTEKGVFMKYRHVIKLSKRNY